MNSSKKYKYEYFLDYETDLQLISSPSTSTYLAYCRLFKCILHAWQKGSSCSLCSPLLCY